MSSLRMVIETVDGGRYVAEPTFGDLRRSGLAFDELTEGNALAMLEIAYGALKRAGSIDVPIEEFLDGVPFDGVTMEGLDAPDPTGDA